MLWAWNFWTDPTRIRIRDRTQPVLHQNCAVSAILNFKVVKHVLRQALEVYPHNFYVDLMVLTKDKRGELKVIAFDRSSFELFTLRFSTKSVKAPSSERPKTTQRTLFLSFEINNYLQITAPCRAVHTFHIIHLIETAR